jgi:hypothetical protein
MNKSVSLLGFKIKDEGKAVSFIKGRLALVDEGGGGKHTNKIWSIASAKNT